MKKQTSRSILHVLVYLIAALSARPALAVAWVEKHDLTAAGYQTEFSRWSNAPFNLRPVCITGYEEGGQARYAAIFENTSGAAWASAYGLTAAQFQSQNTTKAGAGYWPVFLQGFTVGGIAYFNVIWESHRYPVGSVAADTGLTRAALTGAVLARVSQGFTLAYLSTYTQGGLDMYAAIWSKNVSSSSVQCGYGLSAAAYQTQFNSMAGQGFRLAAHTVSLEGTEERFTCVWKKPNTAWWAYAGLSELNFQAETWNAYYTGYRPAFVAVHPKNGESRFSAVWVYNGGLTPAKAAPIYNAVNTYMATNNVPGLSLSISRNGRLVFARGFGRADVDNDQWVHPHHRFRIASVSKPITAAAVMRLRDDGLLASGTNRVFGTGSLLGTTYGTQAYSAGERAITVNHLLSHTTGWTNDGQLWNNSYGIDHKAIIGWQLDNANQAATPGNAYQYMNTDYCVAGRVIERLSGTNYEAYVKREVLAPCGITDMELGNQTLAGRKLNEVVYYASPGAADPYTVINPRRMDANGGWIAKPNDLLLFMRRMDGQTLNTDIISSARLNEMLTVPPPGSMNYGLGMFFANSAGGVNGWGHNGCMAGSRSFLIHRTDGLDFAVTLNIDVPSDGCTWNLRAGIDSALSAIAASDWPDYDLFASVNPEYDAWAVQNLPYYARFQPGLKEDFWGPEADYDRDGLPNLMEGYFSSNPTVPNTTPFSYLVENGAFVVRWWVPIFASQNGVQLSSEYKTKLGLPTWFTGPTVQPGPSWGSYETRAPLSQRPYMFQRFKATAP